MVLSMLLDSDMRANCVAAGLRPDSKPALIVLRAGLVLALVAGLVTIGLNLSRLRQKVVALQANLIAQTQARNRAEANLTSTTIELAGTRSTLKQTQTALEAVSVERDRALTQEAAQKTRADKVSSELAEGTRKLSETQQELARYRAAGLEPEQIVNVRDTLKELQANVVALLGENTKLKGEVKRLATIWIGLEGTVPLPAGLTAKVLVTDPKWKFVILDAGEKQGILERGEVLLSRHGKLVGRAKVCSVQAEHCVANLMPAWDIGEVMEGDLAIAAAPRS